jgi:hypothetical protein
LLDQSPLDADIVAEGYLEWPRYGIPDGVGGLSAVTVVWAKGRDRISVCTYLVDQHCSGFESAEDFPGAAAKHLGEWQGPSAITFGLNRLPHYMSGPYDNVLKTSPCHSASSRR